MNKKFILIIITIILLVGTFTINYFQNGKVSDMSYTTFLSQVEAQNIKEVILEENSNYFSIITKDSPTLTYHVLNPKTDNFMEYLLLNNIPVRYGQLSSITSTLQALIILSLIGGAFYYFRHKDNGNNLITNANKNSVTHTNMTLNNVAGNVEAKAMVLDIISFIKEPEKYSQVGAKMPRGVLLYGPPGTGKTLLAKAIAGEADVPFYAMSGSDFVQMYVGVGASRIRNLFQKAKKSEKAVIFIDEIDTIGKKRGKSASASNDERDQTLNALLTEMSGFKENNGIVVIAATNRLDTLDEALLRPGRFDRQVEIGLPDINARTQILKLHGKNKPLSDDINFDSLAKSTVCFSGAMLENLLNEAAIFAANDNLNIITSNHIDKAFYTVLAGAQKQDRSYISNLDRKVTAYHEAGHALITKLLLPEQYISKVTIIPSVRGAAGFNLTIPKDSLYQTNKQIRSNIQVLLAGRAAEEIAFGLENITTGASNDIQKSSALIMDYINKYGMDMELGLFSNPIDEGFSDDQLIDKCREQMNLLYNQTKNLLTKHMNLLELITCELLEKESLDSNDIERICA